MKVKRGTKGHGEGSPISDERGGCAKQIRLDRCCALRLGVSDLRLGGFRKHIARKRERTFLVFLNVSATRQVHRVGSMIIDHRRHSANERRQKVLG